MSKKSTREGDFPRRCIDCGKEEVWPAQIDYQAEVKHDGRLHKFRVRSLRVHRCRACGEFTIPDTSCEEIYAGLRQHLAGVSTRQNE